MWTSLFEASKSSPLVQQQQKFAQGQNAKSQELVKRRNIACTDALPGGKFTAIF